MLTYDSIIIGSGFGGAVAACRLAEQGRSVLVLERGRRWGRKDFPRTGQADAPWRFQNDRTGLFEIRRFPGMKVIVAAGVGGGSLVYTNVQKVPPASAFKGWPEPISLPRLQPYYERVRAMLEPTPLPGELQRVRAFEAAHVEAERVRPAELQGRVERPSLAVRWGEGDREIVNRFGARQQPCNLCGNCALGCERHSKNTLDLTYLKRAQDLGALVWPLCQVTRIARARLGGPTGTVYEVCFRRRGEENEGEEKVRARSVYVAAGSLGTTELLLRCRDRERTLPKLSPRLGHQWSANGDFFAGLLDARLAIEPTRGPSVAAAYDAAEHGGFYVLEGAIPPALLEGRRRALGWLTGAVSALRLSYRRPPSAAAEAETPACGDDELEGLLRHMGAFFLMGRDASDGRLRLDRRGALDLLWVPRGSELLFNRMRRYLRLLGRGYGGWMIAPQPWWAATVAGTVHPLGGCPMGRDAAEGVVDACGRVFGYDNLYLCDGSIIPRALGVPPSMTIAALAEFVLERSLEP